MKQPKYPFGQSIPMIIETEDKRTGLKFQNKAIMFITSISLEAGEDHTYFYYGLSTEIPQPYSSQHPRIFLREEEIKL